MCKKICSKCLEEKDIKHFEFRKDTNKYRGQCRKCNKGYELNKEEKQEIIKSLFNEGLKKCGKFNEIKTLDNFNNDKQTTTGKTSLCKECIKNKYTLEEQKDAMYRLKYGLSLEIYNKMCDRQNNKCLICKKEPEKLVVDHCHTSGIVRGLLCHNCNAAIGLLKEDINSLNNAIKYINNNK